MGHFLDEEPAKKTYKGHFLDEEPTATVDGKPAPIKRVQPDLTKAFAYGGAPGVGLTPGSEDILPMVGQAIGGTMIKTSPLRMIPKADYVGSVAGSMIGDIGQQGARSFYRLFDKEYAKPDWGGVVPRSLAVGTIEGATRGFGKFINPKLAAGANRLMLSIMKPARDVVKRNPNLGLEVLEEGISGSKEKMLSKAEDVISGNESKIQGLIKGQPQLVNTLKVADEIEKIKAPFLNVGDDASVQAIDEVKNAILKKGGIRKGGRLGLISLEEANQLKRDLYSVLKSSQYGKGVGEIPVKATARKTAAYGLRKGIEGAVPAIKPLSKGQSTAIKAREALENRLANEQKFNLIGLPDIGLGLMGTVTGALTGDENRLGRSLGLGISGLLARRFLGSDFIQSQVARILANEAKKRVLGRSLTLGLSSLGRRNYHND